MNEGKNGRMIPVRKYEFRQFGNMKSLLIADTTREEREQIVTESIGNIDGACDDCSLSLIKMYMR